MDLSNKPRHTFRELVRLRADVREEGGIGDLQRGKVSLDVLVAKPAIKREPLARLADELARQAVLQPSNPVDSCVTSGVSRGLVLSFKNLLESASGVARLNPTVELLSCGNRIERFDNGSEVVKDALGCVQEVRSPWGERLCLCYDSSGNLDSFVRVDSQGDLKIQGCRDKHGVVVCNCLGRVCAIGVSMAVSPWGRLTIHNASGQFLALDLVRQLHIERHILDSLDESCSAVTGVFAWDGFRLATVFQEFQKHCAVGMPGKDGSSRLRMYGRDGSAIEFAGEDALRNVSPASVWPPGSFSVKGVWRGHHQAITAWESMKTYLGVIS